MSSRPSAAEWGDTTDVFPVAKGKGRPRKYVLREVMNGIRYVQRYGIPWDAMPKDLPPGSICYDYWRLLADGGHMERVDHNLVMADREKAGREASPTLAIVDAQSVKCDAPQGERGYDAGKKVVGRKRHIAVDIDGRLLAVDVTTADVQDQDGGIPLVQRLVRLCPWIKTVVVDGGYKALSQALIRSQSRGFRYPVLVLVPLVDRARRPTWGMGDITIHSCCGANNAGNCGQYH